MSLTLTPMGQYQHYFRCLIIDIEVLGISLCKPEYYDTNHTLKEYRESTVEYARSLYDSYLNARDAYWASRLEADK
jgi:hypothetical protein